MHCIMCKESLRAKSPRWPGLLSLAIAATYHRNQHIFDEEIERCARGPDGNGCKIANVAILTTDDGKNYLNAPRDLT